ncbi:MAG: flippase-like domain-containing protein [Lentisphaerae bacterium]|nr:flippase-like domain-containing protein [Lentisphaerota bacterium]
MSHRHWPLRLVGLVLFAALLVYAHPGQVWAAARDVRVVPLLLAAAAAIGVIVLRNIRWKYMLAFCGGTIRWRDLWPLALVSSFLGNLTPGRAGELWKMTFAGATTFTRSQYLVSFFYDRLLDAATMALLAFAGLIGATAPGTAGFRFALGAIVGLSIAAVAGRRQIRVWIERAMRRYDLPWQPLSRAAGATAGRAAVMLVAHVLSVVLYIAIYAGLFRAVGVSVPVAPLTVAASVASMVAILPISVAGLGTREAVLLHFLRPYYDAPSQVILVGMLDVVLLAYVLSGLLALPCWLLGYPRRSGGGAGVGT